MHLFMKVRMTVVQEAVLSMTQRRQISNLIPNLKQFMFQQNITFISESFEQHFCLIIIFAVSGCQLRGWPGRT
jgi:hypothetical protein